MSRAPRGAALAALRYTPGSVDYGVLTDTELREHLRADGSELGLRASCSRAHVERMLFGRTDPLLFPAGASFIVRERLGAGGMGIVYEVEPEGSRERLALKVLFRADGDAAFRLKREFRTLAGLAHPNLVTLHELFADERGAAFTMELVRGHDFVTSVQPEGRLDCARLRAALAQLAHALSYLHAAGIVHRDVKPNNLLVTSQGRLVVLDFGIAAAGDDGEAEAAGTLRFMPDEQRAGRAVAASDMYAVGALIELCLDSRQPPSPLEPLDFWHELSAELCAADPACRPSASRLIERLETTRASPYVPSRRRDPIGRTREQASALAAFDAPRSGPELLAICGDSGLGKTTLLDAVVRRMRACDPDALVLEASCSHRELVPYRALDPAVDALGSWLQRRPLPALPAAGIHALLDLFPSLRRVAGFLRQPRDTACRVDPRERRRAAIQCLRALLIALGREHRVVLCIDDAQWIDPDSLSLLEQLLAEPGAPAMLFIAVARDASALGGLGKLFERTSLLELGPLPDVDALALARELLPANPTLWQRAVTLSRGDPLVLTELCEHAPAHDGLEATASFESLLRRRLQHLVPLDRQMLELVAVAREPIALDLLAAAQERDIWEVRHAMQQLALERLIRITRAQGLVSEPYHARVRRVVEEELPVEASSKLHRTLARALEAVGPQRHASSLFYHWREARDFARALPFARSAAAQAAERLAFLDAAELYRSAALLASQADERAALQESRAAMLANAGRDRRAAEILAELAGRSDAPARRTELRRQAIALFYRSGADGEGHAQLLPWLDELSLPRPDVPAYRHLGWFVYYRARTRLGFPQPYAIEPSAGDALTRARIDACLAVARWWGMGRIAVGLHYHARSLHLALGAGTPEQLAYALLHGAVRHSLATSALHSEQSLARAAELCERGGDRPLHAQLALARAQCALIRMDFRRAHHESEVASSELAANAHNVSDRVLARGIAFTTRHLLGDTTFSEELKTLLEDAALRGDAMLQANLRTNLAEQHLLAGDTLACRDVLTRTTGDDRMAGPRRKAPPVDGRAWARWLVLVKRDLYLGRPDAAQRRSRRSVRAFQRRGLLHVPVIRVMTRHLSALVHAANGGERSLRAIARIRRGLAREPFPYAHALSLHLEGIELALRGERERAIERFAAASRALESVGDVWQAWASAATVDELEGRDSEVTARLDALKSRGVAEPRRYLSIYAPLLRKDRA